MIVLDTNIVLDAFVFHDPAAQPLKVALAARRIQWLATQPMRDELERVLTYPKIVVRLAFHQIAASDVLAQFDTQVRLVDLAPKASVTCRDPDDQKFIDLAVAHKTVLLSKDRAVLCMKKRLLTLDVQAYTAIDFAASTDER
ncbi:putative toxin-antitoxin system toxin component, PIN family [Rhodoferax sp.]|uniref:putative toxin-antitoxin system toxin component, PIN family n=1 Tax=Rhodoferax sp. TaxID=50421 RepID=UPI0027260710|nr:putative toxin-antitoxin system toxin component, PIN family [Rhodoferax sp.]MDO9197479.1 putative toxin-antitoxin system toxin component, PIN family [Rhodoferax sp.]